MIQNHILVWIHGGLGQAHFCPLTLPTDPNNKKISKLSFFCSLIIGILCGSTLGYIFLKNINLPEHRTKETLIIERYHEEQTINKLSNTKSIERLENSFLKESVESQNRVRLLCWVMTSPTNHETKAIHVKSTWGQRCDILLFMSSKGDFNLPAVALPVHEGRDNLWAKTKEAFKYIYYNYFDRADWFYKADDDTYLVVENLKYLLAPHNTSEALYFGWRFKHLVKLGFMSGGAGYVLSKCALRKFILQGVANSTICRFENDGNEDSELGQCMENLGVTAMNTRDSLGRERFFPKIPTSNLIPGHSLPDFWYFDYAYYPQREGIECCSNAAISFHYVTPEMMYVIENLIYNINPYGTDRKMYRSVAMKNQSLHHNIHTSY